jgi:hypothetical protein
MREKQGVFGSHEAQEINNALLALLQAVADERFLASAAISMSTYERCFENCTKRDLAHLRENLKGVQGILMSGRTVSVNKPGEYVFFFFLFEIINVYTPDISTHKPKAT